MSDPAFLQLLATLPQDTESRILIVLDENCQRQELVQVCAHLSRYPNALLLSNRFDIADSCIKQGASCQFSDLEFSPIADGSLDMLLFRVAKEKAVTHRVINCAAEKLRTGGQLYLCGRKQEGIKTFISKAGELLQDTCRPIKNGDAYHALITRIARTDALLDDNDYATLRNINPPNQPAIFSKPGLFGWHKIDQGSALLAQYFCAMLPEADNGCADWLDLGCGYGYLSLQATWQAEKGGTSLNLVATDNNAAALIACEKNFADYNIEGRVVGSDCAQQIAEKFDVVISHPPFHRGFNADQQLGEKFVASARTHLKPGGRALMVVNSFIPLEKLASKYFAGVRILENNGQFKVVLMSQGS